MSFAPAKEIFNIDGIFTEKTFGNYFEFINGANEWAEGTGATHTIWVKDGTRPAIIKKTVAYIMVDEDDNGPVWEKWEIKNFRKYEKNC